MTQLLKPGRKGESLPAGQDVFRFVQVSKAYRETGRVNPAAFALTDDDETSELKSLSVWVARLTEPQQALQFLEQDDQREYFGAFLNVDEIRALRPEPNSMDVPDLDVVWDSLMMEENGMILPDTRDQGPKVTRAKQDFSGRLLLNNDSTRVYVLS